MKRVENIEQRTAALWAFSPGAALKKLESAVTGFSRLLDKVAGLCLVGIMVVVCLNILGRKLFGLPIVGTQDLVSFLTAGVVGLSIAYCAVRNGHIAVGLIVDKLPRKVQAVTDSIVNLLALCFWATAAWHIAKYAESTAVNSLVSSTAEIPMHPFIYMVSLGIALMCLVLVLKFIDSLKRMAVDR